MDKDIVIRFALELKKNKFPLNRSRRYDVKHIHQEIDSLTEEYLNKKEGENEKR